MKMDVIGFGESSVDLVYVVEGLPQTGTSKLRICSRYSSTGGQVATTMAACAALGVNAAYLGVIGDDENGGRVEQGLREHGVDTTRTMRRKASTRYAVILVDRASGERVVLWERDAGLDVPPADLHAGLIDGARIVHVDGTDPAAAIALARLARERGVLVTCDIDEVTPRTTALLEHVTVPILAEHVPLALTGIDDTEAALRQLRADHQESVYVTLGVKGAAALDDVGFVHSPAFPVNAIDTTGAGDVFRAGVIYGLLRDWAPERTLRFANAAAAVSCTRIGAINGVPGLDDVERFMR